jgi:Flp pilus assembly pilin Flp
MLKTKDMKLRRLYTYPKGNSGAAAIEFALILPVLLILSLPLVDYFQYIMTIQKMNKTAASVADMLVISTPGDGPLANSDPFALTGATLTNVLQTSDFLMHPFPFTGAENARVTVNSIVNQGGTVSAPWSAVYNGGGGVSVQGIGDTNVLPAGFLGQMFDDENAIAVTVEYRFEPVIPLPGLGFIPSLAAEDIRITQFFPARNGALTCVRNVNC